MLAPDRRGDWIVAGGPVGQRRQRTILQPGLTFQPSIGVGLAGHRQPCHAPGEQAQECQYEGCQQGDVGPGRQPRRQVQQGHAQEQAAYSQGGPYLPPHALEQDGGPGGEAKTTQAPNGAWNLRGPLYFSHDGTISFRQSAATG